MNAIELANYIAYLIQNNYYVAGHSIFNRTPQQISPDKILKEGLIIQDVSCGLPFTSRYFSLPLAECLFNLRGFIEDTSSGVIIIAIPKELLSPYESKYFKSYNNTSIVLDETGEYSSDYTDVYGNPTRIAILPPIYILGYLDVQKDMFMKNPTYAFNGLNKDITISKLKPLLDKRYEELLKKEAFYITKNYK